MNTSTIPEGSKKMNCYFSNSIKSFSILFLSTLVSSLYLKKIFWLSEMTIFIFSLLVSVGGLLIIFRKSDAYTIKLSTIDIAYLLFVGYSLFISFLKYSPYPINSNIYINFSILIIYIISRLLFYSLKGVKFKRIVNLIIIIAVIQSLIGFYQYVQIFNSNSFIKNPYGTFINPGIFGGFLTIAACLCLLKIFYLKRTTLLSLCLIIILTALILSESRIALVALLIGILSIFTFKYSYILNPKDSKFYIILFLFLSVIFLSTYALFKINPESVNGRITIWKISWTMFKEQPWFGRGLESFFTQYGNYQAKYFLANSGSFEEIQRASMNYFAFNDFLKILVELGVIGFILFTAIFYKIFELVFNKKDVLKQYEFEILSGLLIIISFLCLAISSYPLFDTSLKIILTLSISYFAYLSSLVNSVTSFEVSKKIKITAIIFLITFSFKSLQKIHAIYQWKNAKENILINEGKSFNTYNKIYNTLSNNGLFLYNYGAELYDIGQYNKSLKTLLLATIYGNSVELHTKIGNVYQALNQNELAENSYKFACNLDPKLFVPYYNLFKFYIASNQKDKAKKLAKFILKKPVKVSSIIIDKIKLELNLYIIKP